MFAECLRALVRTESSDESEERATAGALLVAEGLVNLKRILGALGGQR